MKLFLSLTFFFIICTQFSYAEMATNSSSITTSTSNIEMSELSRPTNEFGLRFLEQLNTNNSNKNVIFSPLSVILAYGMLLEGVTGPTEQQIKKVLQLSSIGNQKSDVAQASKKVTNQYIFRLIKFY